MSVKMLAALVVLLASGLGATLRWYLAGSDAWRSETARAALEAVETEIEGLEAPRSGEVREVAPTHDGAIPTAAYIDRLREPAAEDGEPAAGETCREVASLELPEPIPAGAPRVRTAPAPRRLNARPLGGRTRVHVAVDGVDALIVIEDVEPCRTRAPRCSAGATLVEPRRGSDGGS